MDQSSSRRGLKSAQEQEDLYRTLVSSPKDTQSSSTRAYKQAQKQEVAEDRRRPTGTRQSSTCGRDFGTKERLRKQRERGCTRHVVKQLVKDKLLYNGIVPINLELRSLRREKRGTEIQRYGTLNDSMKIYITFTSTQDCHTTLASTSHWLLFYHTFNTHDPVKLQY